MCYHITRTFWKYECGLERRGQHPTLLYWTPDIWAYEGVVIEPPQNVCSRCLFALGLMKIKCAWCDKFLGYKEGQAPDPEHIITHGMCDDCKEIVLYNRGVA